MSSQSERHSGELKDLGATTSTNGDESKELEKQFLLTMPENVEILSELEDELFLTSAAEQSRFPPSSLSPQEASCFPDISRGSNPAKKLYIYFRNKILSLWLIDVRNELTIEGCLDKISPPYNAEVSLISRIFHFLNRYGCINFGIYKPASAPASANTTPKDAPLKVVIIGAGVSGLAAGRQLKSFGFDVTLLEARNRLGGRIQTFEKDNYVADLGAMIITGLGGNPISVIARQVPLDLQKVRTGCPLYEHSGANISAECDETVERLFNKFLEATSYLVNTLEVTQDASGKKLSLGDALDLVLKLQEKPIKERQIEYYKTIYELQEKLKQTQHKLIRLKNLITDLTREFEEATLEQQKSRSAAAGALTGGPSSGDIVSVFLAKSKRRDLVVARGEYEKLAQYERELEDAIRELYEVGKNSKHDGHPETFFSPLSKQVFYWHVANLEFANAAPIHKLSLKHWDQDDDFELTGCHLSIPSGYYVLPEHLAEEPRGYLNVKLDCVVKEVKYGSDEVSLVVCDAGTGENLRTVDCDIVLCTLPLGVLKASCDIGDPSSTQSQANESGSSANDEPDQQPEVSERIGLVKFDPPLPEWKREAVERLGFGNLNKVVLCFEQVFWEPNVNVFGVVSPTERSRGEFFQFWSFFGNRAPLLVGLIAGEAADNVEVLSDDIVVGKAMAILKAIFKGTVPDQPKDVVVTRWKSDPYSRGSYSFVGVDASGDDYDLLAAPVPPSAGAGSGDTKPRLFFAGEHTIRNYPATVHGALLSGLREAGRIADAYLGEPYALGNWDKSTTK